MLIRSASEYFEDSAGGKGDECIRDAPRIGITLPVAFVGGLVSVLGVRCARKLSAPFLSFRPRWAAKSFGWKFSDGDTSGLSFSG